MPLIVGVGLSKVLLQFPHRYMEIPGFLLDKEVFGDLVESHCITVCYFALNKMI